MQTDHEPHQQHQPDRAPHDGNGGASATLPSGEPNIDQVWRRHRARTLWMYFANIMLGIWLLSTPTFFDYRSTSLAWSDAVTGASIVVLGIVALFPRGDFWGRWGICFLGMWLWFAPLVFSAPSAFVYANDTLVGALVISFSVLAPGVPGKAHFRVLAQPGPETPPGWTYNPSSWDQRAPIIALAFAGFLVGRYMTAYQLGHIDSVWDPFFDPGTAAVLTSDVSEAFPVSDAGLGATFYLLEALSGFLGATNRWRTTPWMVALFGILIVPLGVVSITLVVLQPVVVGTWCAPCLLTATFALVMIPMALDEVLATGQFLRRARREGRSLWRTFWVGGTLDSENPNDPTSGPTMPNWPQLTGSYFAIKAPWTLILSTMIGFWIMASPPIFDATGKAANSDFLVGPLIAVVAATAMAEVGRAVRFVNIAFGLWLIAAPWLLGGATTGSTTNDIIAGCVLIALSIPRGVVRDRYGAWQPNIV